MGAGVQATLVAVLLTAIVACSPSTALADPVAELAGDERPARSDAHEEEASARAPQREQTTGAGPRPPSGLDPVTSSADLDGWYLWLGPGGGAAWIEKQWYSTFGATATVVRVRERAWLGALGASLGAARWTERDGGRIWLDAMVGSRRLGGPLVGVGVGPMVEIADLHHPRIGATGSIWVFAGVVPYLRVGVVDAAGGFVEAGVQLSLPALRW